ncbi:uncharacterized protein Caf1-180 [Epargyreus clarus]|uniref:uncharacterized protein Caf1-180 n=1 Tax=Epargyreus clarus TaxID=520877 RepID=UPI003C2BAEAC
MKTVKSPENEEVTPSKKKLKQARLPFKIIDVSPKPDTPPSRKRKLSVPEPEPVTKIGKITKENSAEALVVISDDDNSKDSSKPQEEKLLNPFVKLVDTAWKKKQKKFSKKKKNKKSVATNGSVDSDKNDSKTESKDADDVEGMDVDEEVQEVVQVETKDISEPVQTSENVDTANTDNIVVVEDSNQPEEETGNDKTEHNSSNDNEDIENKSDKHSDVESNHDSEPEKEEPDTKTEPITTTPRHSARNKDREASKLNVSQSTGDESMSSNPSTPRRSMRSTSVSKNQGDVSLNESNTNLTPKQLQKKLESAKKKEERDKEKQERDKKKQQEKEERAKQRLEKEEQRKREKEEKEEARRKEKEEKEEQRRKEREEKERQKELEKKMREEKEEQKRKEKEEKEEQKKKEKEAREEEKRKKQEAMEMEKLEQEQKKKKAAEAFVNFFVPKQKVEKDQTTAGPVSKSSVLSSFTIKSDMRLAPSVRTNFTEEKRQALDLGMAEQNVPEKSLYIKSLRDGVSKPLSSGRTWPLDDKNDDDVMIVEDELPPMDGAGEILTCESTVREKLRPKLFSFHENRRPPYWGTWRKKSSYVTPRRPFKQDQKHLDYEVDSDDDWEEEQEGESIDGSAAGSDDEQEADEYEVDNEVFVPHGYLSDEEATMDEDDVLSLSPETQKARLKHLEDEFELELKKPTEKLKPRLYGLLWETSDGSKPEKCVDALWNYFGKLSMIMNDPTPLLQPSSEPEETEKKKVKKKKSLPESEQQSPKNDKKKAKQDNKESKKPKTDAKKNTPDVKKNQPAINSFLTKIKS